jgi:hypothetical protein
MQVSTQDQSSNRILNKHKQFGLHVRTKDEWLYVTPSSKAKTEYIPLCVSGSSFTHKAINSEINSITSVYYIKSYYKNLLQVQKD